MNKSIGIDDLLKINSPKIIDIRNNYYYNLGHIKGAINIPKYDIITNYRYYLVKYQRYYLYCDTGELSMEVTRRLNSFGYDTINIEGGYQEYVNFFKK